MNNPAKSPYAEARYRLVAQVTSTVTSIAGATKYLGADVARMEMPDLNFFESAYDERLDYMFRLSKRVTMHSLAYAEHYMDLMGSFQTVLSRVADAPAVQQNMEHYEKSVMLPSIKRDVEATKAMFSSVLQQYPDEVALERTSAEYALDRSIINRVVLELSKAAVTGQWEPEIITVNDPDTGAPRNVETPSSAKFRKMAALAPQLARLGFGS